MILTKQQARALLNEGFTCVLYGENETYKSTERGVAPLIQWLQSGSNFHGFAAVDKVVGKAVAFLYVLLGVDKVYAVLISDSAEKVLKEYGIPYTYETKVSAIRNRTGDGFCPMEQAVLDITEPNAAYARIQETLRKLKEQK